MPHRQAGQPALRLAGLPAYEAKTLPGRIGAMSSRRYRRRGHSPLSLTRDGAERGPRHLMVRLCATAAILLIALLFVAESVEFYGELAFARFLYFCRLGDKCETPLELTGAVQDASDEASLIIAYDRGSPDALREVTKTYLRWVTKEELDPALRLGLADTIPQAAALAVCAAPSDYEMWLWLARSQSALGLRNQSDLCLKRAQELAPPGMKLKLLDGT